MKERIAEIDPSSEALNIVITEWVPDQRAAETASGVSQAGKGKSGAPGTASAPVSQDEDFNRNMARIRNIMNMQIAVEEKIKQLNSIEREAQRNIVFEEEKINELKGQLNM
jgi:hypothetical protein